jgi:HEAT repeat protein
VNQPEDNETRLRDLLRPSHHGRWRDEELAELDHETAGPFLAKVVRDESEPVGTRTLAMQLLVYLGDGRSAAPLADVLDARDPVLRARAATALGRLGHADQHGLERLVRGLEDADPFVRESCAAALGALRHVAAVTALRKVRDEDAFPDVREAARQALVAMGEDG